MEAELNFIHDMNFDNLKKYWRSVSAAAHGFQSFVLHQKRRVWRAIFMLSDTQTEQFVQITY